MTIIEALELALEFVECSTARLDSLLLATIATRNPSEIRDDLALAINRMKTKYPAIANEELYLYVALCEIARQLSRLVDALYVLANRSKTPVSMVEAVLPVDAPSKTGHRKKAIR